VRDHPFHLFKPSAAKLLAVVLLDHEAMSFKPTSDPLERAIALHEAYHQAPSANGHPLLIEAIELYQVALEVYTQRDFPVQWATTQNNLGLAYSALPGGDRNANLQQAIACYQAALEVRTGGISPLIGPRPKITWVLPTQSCPAETATLTSRKPSPATRRLSRSLLDGADSQAGAEPAAAARGLVGLPAAFLVAGAQMVVPSLWAVNDFSTALLMQGFHSNLYEARNGKRLAKAPALREAQQWLRDLPLAELERILDNNRERLANAGAFTGCRNWTAFSGKAAQGRGRPEQRQALCESPLVGRLPMHRRRLEPGKRLMRSKESLCRGKRRRMGKH
jgi:hypothetical protein